MADIRLTYGRRPLSGSTRGHECAVISVAPARRWNDASATMSMGRSVRTSITVRGAGPAADYRMAASHLRAFLMTGG